MTLHWIFHDKKNDGTLKYDRAYFDTDERRWWNADYCGPQSEKFGTKRKPRGRVSRTHAACDLMVPAGTEVYPLAAGTVRRRPYKFYTSAKKKITCQAVEIEHTIGCVTFVARYCDIDGNKNLRNGAQVTTDTLLGKVKQLDSSAMLHFEAYLGPLDNDTRMSMSTRQRERLGQILGNASFDLVRAIHNAGDDATAWFNSLSREKKQRIALIEKTYLVEFQRCNRLVDPTALLLAALEGNPMPALNRFRRPLGYVEEQQLPANAPRPVDDGEIMNTFIENALLPDLPRRPRCPINPILEGVKRP